MASYKAEIDVFIVYQEDYIDWGSAFNTRYEKGVKHFRGVREENVDADDDKSALEKINEKIIKLNQEGHTKAGPGRELRYDLRTLHKILYDKYATNT